MTSRPVVAIIGGGFSGTLLALNLLQQADTQFRILLIERSPGFGPGLAFSSPNPTHLLNVRVGNMSAWPDDPQHLGRWLAQRGLGSQASPGAFISRGVYGEYLTSLLLDAIKRPDVAERLILVPDEVVGLERHGRGLRLTLGMGHALDLDAAVLALGNLTPAPLQGLGLEALSSDLYAADPWCEQALSGLASDQPVVLLGSSLTMVDVVLALHANGHRGPTLALSRHGLTPHRHEASSPVAPAPVVLETALTALLQRVRRRADDVGWRLAIDELRPITQAIWRSGSLKERRRFLRHLRPWWDIHRRRMAPPIADRVETMMREGGLQVAAGRVLNVDAHAEEVKLTWRRRGEVEPQVVHARRIINCTGPIGDLTRTTNPLLRSLFDAGAARADSLRLGLDVDLSGRVVDSQGHGDPRLYAVGPITRGAFWECVAVPDIRNQVADLARVLAAGWANAA